MELGKKLLHARQEAGLSQRQLCGGVITRNMLSQIEHGTARPSMDTLRYLAGQLGKPVSFFLEEDAVLSPNHAMMEQARKKQEAGEVQEAWLILKGFQQPDPMLEWEWRYLSFVTALASAERAMAAGKYLYARQLLEQAEPFENGIPGGKRQRLLLLGRVPDTDLPELVTELPSLDEELRLRAKAALLRGNAARAADLLSAAEDRGNPEWNLLQGRALLLQQQYALAKDYLEKAEETFPEQCYSLLETCFRELGDFRKAYAYACKQR